MPVKYNIKDIEKVYKRFNKEADFKKLKEESNVWRKKIIQSSLDLEYKIFISCVENLQPTKKNQKEIKSGISRFLFSNSLMRVGLYSKNRNLDHVQVILDWPESNDSKPFDHEYYYGYNRGENSNGQEYYSGALKSIGFDQTLYYARCNHSNMLQFADIILGSTRDWIETNLEKRDYSLGKELTELFIPKFYGYPNIYKHGINLSTNCSPNFRLKISKLITKVTT